MEAQTGAAAITSIFAGVAAGFFCAFADEAEAPGDEIGIGELQDDAVGDAAGGAEGFGSVACDPDGRNSSGGPGEFCGNAFVIDRAAGVEFAEGFDEVGEIFEGGGFFAEDAARGVSSANADDHAAVGGDD